VTNDRRRIEAAIEAASRQPPDLRSNLRSNFVFVYGTLKQGFGNHANFLRDATFLGDGRSVTRWRMCDGGFPIVLPGDHGHVVGEVYAVDDPTLARLDRLESNGHMYQREVITVAVAAGEIEAWMYVGMSPIWQSADAIWVVEPGPDGGLCWRDPFEPDEDELYEDGEGEDR
jgi:gamma-glutamylcyclotransferase (GGCT)/AIG2-like uncharacterized protein YtfP